MFRFILIILLILPLLSEISPYSQTLQLLASSQSSQSTLFAKAVIFLNKIHPELKGYRVVSHKSMNSRGTQPYARNLKDFHFDLA